MTKCNCGHDHTENHECNGDCCHTIDESLVKEGTITEDEFQILQLVNLIMEQGRKTSKKEAKLYDDLMADADLTNIE